jgi:hypothetical protein
VEEWATWGSLKLFGIYPSMHRITTPLLLLLFLALPTSAQNFSPQIERQIKSGELTREEAKLLYSGGYGKRETPSPRTQPPSPSSNTALSSQQQTTPVRPSGYPCRNSPEVVTRERPYRCCELASQDAVRDAYELGNFYLDGDSDGYACEEYAKTYVGDVGISSDCLNVLRTDIDFHITNDYDGVTGRVRSNNQLLPDGKAETSVKIIRGKPINLPINSVNSQNSQLQNMLNTAVSKTLQYPSESCIRSTGTIVFTAGKIGTSLNATALGRRPQP